MDKLKEKVDKRIEEVSECELTDQNIDFIGKLVDIEKDIAKIKHYEKEEEDMRYRGNYGEYSEGYGRRRRDSRGRFMEGGSMSRGNYGHFMPDYLPDYSYMHDMREGMDGYMEGREQYNRGNYNGKDQSVDSLEKMLEGIVAFVEEIQNDPEQKEEKEVVRHYIKKLKEM